MKQIKIDRSFKHISKPKKNKIRTGRLNKWFSGSPVIENQWFIESFEKPNK